MTIEQAQQQLIDDFSEIDDPMLRYTAIIDLGHELPEIDPKYKTPEHRIEGCQSKVWINAEQDADGKVIFTADSDSQFVKGMISMLISILSGHSPEEILDADLRFIDEIGLSETLSSNRSNGLLEMIKRMRLYAMAFANKDKA